MKAENYWKIFLETGSPEMYLLYSQAKKVEGLHVLDSQGIDTESNKLQ